MTRSFDTREVLKRHRQNRFSAWSRSQDAKTLSPFPDDAVNRIGHRFAIVEPSYLGPRLAGDAKIYAMGSCFAREIEVHLIRRGGRVVSVDRSIERPEFADADGIARSGYFHRFTPLSMLQEFRSAFGELPGWTETSLLYPTSDGVLDLNYTYVEGGINTPDAVRTRRSIAHALVRRAAEADVVILTLGLIEAWIHKASGFTANWVGSKVLVRNPGDFELHVLGFAETLDALEEIRALVSRHNPKAVQFVISVSPVPLSATFTEKDIIVANADSKATLRAAAAEFCARHDDVHYFPSYEMVNYSITKHAWRADRSHVRELMVEHIVDTFIESYYRPGALAGRAAVSPALAAE